MNRSSEEYEPKDDEKNSKNANEIIDLVPIDKILIETDSPYLTPTPFRGQKNSSKYTKNCGRADLCAALRRLQSKIAH